MAAKISLIVDTREQLPWAFDTELFDVQRGTLATGDVSVKGFENLIAIERKSLGDAVNTVIGQWQRFLKEIYRLAAMDHPAVFIEASIADILDRKYESDAEPLAVLGRLNSITIDHKIPVYYCGSRAVAETLAERWLLQAAKKLGAASNG